MAFMAKRWPKRRRKPKPEELEEWKIFCRVAAKLDLAKQWLIENPRPRLPTMIAKGNTKPQLHQDDIDKVTQDYMTFFHSEEIGQGEDLSITTQAEPAIDPTLPADSLED